MSDANRTQAQGHYAARSASPARAIWLIGLVAALVVLLALGGDETRSLLRYERDAVLMGHEYWRWVTAHFVHANWQHASLNLAGLAVIGALFPKHYSPLSWVVIAAVSVAAIDVGFVWYEPQLQWYVGLSGVLHGLLAAGAVAWWRCESKVLALALTLLLVLKLGWEQTQGAMPFSGDMPVIVAAHLYGALGGVAAAVLIWCGQQHWPWRRRPL